VEKISRPLAFRRRVLSADVIGAAKRLGPGDGCVEEQPVAQVFLDLPESQAAIGGSHPAVCRGVAHGLQDETFGCVSGTTAWTIRSVIISATV